MAVKYFDLEDIGPIRVTKRSGSRSLRISITAAGEVRVTIPAWSHYQSGVDFASSRADWIRSNVPAAAAPLQAGQAIGKAHHLVFLTAAIDAPSSRIAGGEIRITRPLGMALTHPGVQKVAHRACIRALRSQAEALLPQRLKTLAAKHEFTYNSVNVKQLKGRWGSCDSHQDIVLNLFLMQLPWQLIDYVLIHELIHTEHLNHSPDFWAEFLRHEPAAKSLRKQIRTHKPILEAIDTNRTVA